MTVALLLGVTETRRSASTHLTVRKAGLEGEKCYEVDRSCLGAFKVKVETFEVDLYILVIGGSNKDNSSNSNLTVLSQELMHI